MQVVNTHKLWRETQCDVTHWSSSVCCKLLGFNAWTFSCDIILNFFSHKGLVEPLSSKVEHPFLCHLIVDVDVSELRRCTYKGGLTAFAPLSICKEGHLQDIICSIHEAAFGWFHLHFCVFHPSISTIWFMAWSSLWTLTMSSWLILVTGNQAIGGGLGRS